MNGWKLALVAVASLGLATGCTGMQATSARGGETSEGTLVLFDGGSVDGWRQVGPGRFTVQPGGTLASEGGMGLFYYAERPFRDFVLELDYRTQSVGTNSGVFLRFPELTDDPSVAFEAGYEIQIDDSRDPITQTGAVSTFSPPGRLASRAPGEWNQYRIEVRGQRYEIYLNGEKVNDFVGSRAREGYIGIQNYDADSPIEFRDIRVTPLNAADAPESLAGLFGSEGTAPIRVLTITTTHGFRHTEAIDAAREVLPTLAQTTEFRFDLTEDLTTLNPANLANYDLLFIANATLRAEPAIKDSASIVATRTERVESPMTLAQQQAVVEFVKSGKGLVVAHAGLDALYGFDEYREMVGGGLFESHPWTRSVRINVEDPANAAVEHLGDGFWIRDEIYVLDENPRWNSHVLLSLDMPSVGVTVGSPDATRDDYPISWLRRHGEGRVFATKLGHFGDVWRNPAFLEHLLTGMRQAAGRAPADFSGHRVKETIADNVWPDDLKVDERGNVWIVELTGKVHRYDAATGRTALVGEIPTSDPTNIEHGLYGVEIDPNFYGGDPYVYLYYAERESFVNTLSRFTFANGQIDLQSERVLLRVPTEPACCHQAGDLEWGPDGTLFVSTGDTGQSGTRPTQEITPEAVQAFVEGNRLDDYHWSRLTDSERTSQNLQDLRGKILRINKDGSIPKDNPFYGDPGVRWEIYSYGLRNPYRIKYDAPTGRVFIGIVGPDEQTTYDWYDVAQAGGENFGWPRANGRLFYNEWTPQQIPAYVPPLWEYTYATGSRSATFGPIYRSDGDKAFPDVFQGKAFVYDWSRKWIKWGDVVNGVFESDTTGSVRQDGRQFRIPAKRLANLKTFATLEGTSPISMDVGPDGCLYVAEFTGFWAPAPGSNVSRYCWIDDDVPAADAPTTMSPTP